MASPSSYTSTVRFANTPSQDGIALPTGTNIYQEVAWLMTQATHYTSGAGAGTTEDAIQDAIWNLTEGNAPTNSNYHSSVSGSYNSSLNPYLWATLAANATNLNSSVNLTYTTANAGSITLYAANYSTWEVIDQTSGLGAVGTNGQYQELLTQVSAAPEPGTFALLGGVLAAVAFRKRRKA